MSEQPQDSQAPLTREQYRQQETRQPTSETSSLSGESRQEKRVTRAKRRWWPFGQKNAVPHVASEGEPEAQRAATQSLTGEQKRQRLAHRLNVTIMILIGLILLVYIILRFVG
ncbi:hypothetical protein [Furfurilactobacillus curtus]|uniref:Uncharacterized protein n=1 Tax=Furfurilactobacillus curtus TaxID=1746200 RepID=A0ABQ5JR82_9LACO